MMKRVASRKEMMTNGIKSGSRKEEWRRLQVEESRLGAAAPGGKVAASALQSGKSPLCLKVPGS